MATSASKIVPFLGVSRGAGWRRQFGLTPLSLALLLLAPGAGVSQALAQATPAPHADHAQDIEPLETTPTACPPEEKTPSGQLPAPSAATPQSTAAAAPILVDPDAISSKDGLLRATLTVDQRNVTIGDQTVQALTYNGAFLGPTLRVYPGDTMELTLRNCIRETTNLHFHGMNVSPNGLADNIFRVIDPGQAAPYVVRVTPEQAAGTYWYHDHLHGRSSPHVSGGLSGLIIVEGLRELLPPDLQKITEHDIALKDAHAVDGVMVQTDITVGQPTTRTVNGQIQPQIRDPAGRDAVVADRQHRRQRHLSAQAGRPPLPRHRRRRPSCVAGQGAG